jgi:hypothetical protein
MFMRIVEATRIFGGTEGLTALSPFPNVWVEIILCMGGMWFVLFSLRRFINSDFKINVIPFAKFGSPRYSTFFGASKLTAKDIYGSLKISKVDYEYAGKFNTPVTFMESFSTFFDQSAKVPLKSIIISVKNFYNSRLYQQLYNIIF